MSRFDDLNRFRYPRGQAVEARREEERRPRVAREDGELRPPEPEKREKKTVLFVCIGNACRSPMAEGFARAYGSDVIHAKSAGLAPAMDTAEFTRKVMAEKNIDLSLHLPRRFDEVNFDKVHMMCNMSGERILPRFAIPILEWDVKDPIGESEEQFRKVRDEIEELVMRLVLDVRSGKFDSQPALQRQ